MVNRIADFEVAEYHPDRGGREGTIPMGWAEKDRRWSPVGRFHVSSWIQRLSGQPVQLKVDMLISGQGPGTAHLEALIPCGKL